jgi:hypothetical protein
MMYSPSTLNEGSESIYYSGSDEEPGLGAFPWLFEYFLAFNGYLPFALVGTRNGMITFLYAMIHGSS